MLGQILYFILAQLLGCLLEQQRRKLHRLDAHATPRSHAFREGFQALEGSRRQRILIHVVKGLPSFRDESKLSTWLYRIAVNHLLNVKKEQWAVADAVCSFSVAAAGLQQVPDLDPPDPTTVPVPFEILLEEVKVSCTMGTLLCIDGRQRLVFILGIVFGVSDEVGAEIVGVTPVNFRQILSRARRDLYEYLRGNCSLVDQAASCKCARKTRAYIQGGFVDPNNLRFTARHLRRIVAGEREEEIAGAHMKIGDDVYRNHPFCEPSEQIEKLRRHLKRPVKMTAASRPWTRAEIARAHIPTGAY